MLIVDSLEAVNVHVGGDELLSRPMGSVDLALQILESHAAPACTGELVSPGVLAVAPGRLAVTLSELAVDGSQRSVIFSALATERSLLATLCVVSTPYRQRASIQLIDVLELKCCRVVGVCLPVTSGGKLVALACRFVAVSCALVAPMRDRRRLGRRVSGGARVKPALMLGAHHVAVCDSTAVDG
jgi:hypothetical protein